MKKRVLIDCRRLVGSTIAPHVGRHGAEPGLGKCQELMAPRVPTFRKAVAEQDQWTLALFGEVHPNAIRLDDTMPHFTHRTRPPCSG
jgi:hypothetical protein